MISTGVSFCYETVFSHQSKIDFIKQAMLSGYVVNLIYIHLDSPDLNVARVFQRVSEGGHKVPEDKILSRIPRTQENIKAALLIADYADVYDNSDDIEPHKLQASVERGICTYCIDEVPEWLKEILPSPGSQRGLKLNQVYFSVHDPVTGEKMLRPHTAKTCTSCGGFLRGKMRVAHGICSKCDPKYEMLSLKI